MRKYFFLTVILFLLTGNFIYAQGTDIELVAKGFSCTAEGVKVSYGVKNGRNFTRPNIRIGFKVLVDGKPIACELVVTSVPANSNGDQITDLMVPAPCEGKSYRVESAIFGSSTKKYRIDNWMAECQH